MTQNAPQGGPQPRPLNEDPDSLHTRLNALNQQIGTPETREATQGLMGNITEMAGKFPSNVLRDLARMMPDTLVGKLAALLYGLPPAQRTFIMNTMRRRNIDLTRNPRLVDQIFDATKNVLEMLDPKPEFEAVAVRIITNMGNPPNIERAQQTVIAMYQPQPVPPAQPPLNPPPATA